MSPSLLALAVLALPALAKKGPRPLTCPDGTERIPVDCSTDVGLKNRVAQVNGGIPSIGLGFGGTYEETASTQISDATYQLALELEGLCKQYNACVLGPDSYQQQSAAARQRLTTHLELGAQLAAGQPVGDQLWQNAVPDQASQRVTLDYQVLATTGDGRRLVHQTGQPLATGDEIAFAFSTSTPTWVYVLLLSSQGEASQIFPSPMIGLDNPLPPGQPVRVPPQGAFELDEVTGTETLHLIASAAPLTDIEARLAELQGEGAGDSKGLLQAVGGLLCDKADVAGRGLVLTASSVACDGVEGRGLKLVLPERDPGAEPEQGGAWAAVPGDDVVVVQHQIIHVD